MRFLRRRSESPDPSPTAPLTGDDARRLEAVWRLTALPREEFRATYEAMFARAWAFAAGSSPECAGVRAEVLNAVTAALRARQGRILPRFAAAEDSGRMAELMSFALAAAVLADRFGRLAGRVSERGWRPWKDAVPAQAAFGDVGVPRSFGLLLAIRFAGPEGGAWLAQEPVVVRELAAYFGAGPSELRDIADAAMAAIGVRQETSSFVDVSGNGSKTAENGAEKGSGGPLSSPRTENRGESPARFASEAREVLESAGDGRYSAGDGLAGRQMETDLLGDPVRRPEIGTEAVGWRWINWVRDGIAAGRVRVNEDGGWLHNIDGDAFAVLPACFEAYAAETEGEWKTVKNQVTRLRRHRTRETRSGAASTFTAELADGRLAQGLLFEGDLFWEESPPPAADAVLRRRRRR